MVRFSAVSTLGEDGEALLRQRAEFNARDPDQSVQQISGALSAGRLSAVNLYDDAGTLCGLSAWRWVDSGSTHAQVILQYTVSESPPDMGDALVGYVFSELMREHALAVIEARMRDESPGVRESWLRRDAVLFERCRLVLTLGVLPLPVLPAPAGYQVVRWDDRHQAAVETLAAEVRNGTVDEVAAPELCGGHAAEVLRRWRGTTASRGQAWSDAASLVALDRRGNVVGYVALTIDDQNAQIIDLGIQASHRRRGLARLLAVRSLAACMELGVVRVSLGLTTRNPVRLLCTQLGFQPTDCGEVALWWRDGRQTVWRD